MNNNITISISFAVSALFAVVAARFLIVQVVDATVLDLIFGFGSAVISLSSLSFGISRLIK